MQYAYKIQIIMLSMYISYSVYMIEDSVRIKRLGSLDLDLEFLKAFVLAHLMPRDMPYTPYPGF